MSQTEITVQIPPYKEVEVYNGPNEQFIPLYWWSRSENKYVREKIRFSAAKKRLDREQRLKGLQFLAKELNAIIRHRNKFLIYHEDVKLTEGTQMLPLVKWLEILQLDPDIADSTKRTIGSLKFSYSNFLKKNPVFAKNVPSQITVQELKEYIKYLKASGRVGKTINQYLWAIQHVSEILKARDMIAEAIDTESLRVKHASNETGMYRPLEEWEKKKIFDYSREKDPPFYLYLMGIYYTCIRPGELHRLFVENVRKDTILVPWYDAKNGLTNHVQILDSFKRALIDHRVYTKPKDYYLFGKGFLQTKEVFSGRRGAERWRTMCRHLRIDDSANMYGLKHTFNRDYVENNKHNIDWEWLRRHNRHATIQQTQEYISKVTAYFLDESKAVIPDYHTVDK